MTEPPIATDLERPRGEHARRIARNTTAQMVSQITVLVIGLALTPYTLAKVGLSGYGLWGLVASIISYAVILDPGISVIVTRYIAAARERRDPAMIGRLISFGFLGYALLALVTAPLAIWLVPVLANHLHTNAISSSVSQSVLRLGFVLFYLTMGAWVLAGLMIGVGRQWLVSLASGVTRVVYGIAAVILLARGDGIFSLIDASFISTGAFYAMLYVMGRRQTARVFGNPFRMERGLISELARFGGWSQISSVARAINNETDPLIIASVISLADAGIYNVADSVAGQVSYLPLAAAGSLLPQATIAFERNDYPALRALSIQSGRIMGLATAIFVAVIGGAGPVLYRAWLGHSYPYLDLVCMTLLLTYSINNLAAVPMQVGKAIKQPGLVARNSILGAALNIALTVALVFPFGLMGILIGTLVGVTLRVARLWWQFGHLINLTMRRGILSWLTPLLAATLVAIGSGRLVLWLVPAHWLAGGRGPALEMLPPLLLVILVIMAAGLRLSRFFEPEDLNRLQAVTPRRLRWMFQSRAMRLLTGANA